MKLTILYETDPLLHRVSEPVEKITPKIRKMVEEMFETMYAAKGIGLAAPQVGILKRVIIVDMKRRGSSPLALVNPVITMASGSQTNEEGCLSCPGLWASVERAASVTITGLDDKGCAGEMTVEGILAAVIQHEIDHLDGVLFLDRLTPTERVKVERQRQAVPQM